MVILQSKIQKITCTLIHNGDFPQYSQGFTLNLISPCNTQVKKLREPQYNVTHRLLPILQGKAQQSRGGAGEESRLHYTPSLGSSNNTNTKRTQKYLLYYWQPNQFLKKNPPLLKRAPLFFSFQFSLIS